MISLMLVSKPSVCAVICDILPQNETVASVKNLQIGFYFLFLFVRAMFILRSSFSVCFKQIYLRKRELSFTDIVLEVFKRFSLLDFRFDICFSADMYEV